MRKEEITRLQVHWKCGYEEGWDDSIGKTNIEVLALVKEERSMFSTTTRRKNNWVGPILRGQRGRTYSERTKG